MSAILFRPHCIKIGVISLIGIGPVHFSGILWFPKEGDIDIDSTYSQEKKVPMIIIWFNIKMVFSGISIIKIWWLWDHHIKE